MADPVRVLRPARWTAIGSLAQIATLFSYADLLNTLTRHRIQVRYKQSVLGSLWAVLQPLAMMAVFTAVFTRLVRVPSEGYPYAVFAYAGLLPWTFFSSAVSNGTGSLVSHAQLVTKVYFPREILPLSYVLAAIVDLVIGAGALIVLLLVFRVPITPEVFAVVPAMIVLGAFALGCTLVLSAVQVRFRDVGVALPVALQLLMFASPVLYPLGVVPAAWRSLYVLNPVAGCVEAFRRAVLGMPMDDQSFVVAAVLTAAALPVAYIVFKHAETTVADVI